MKRGFLAALAIAALSVVLLLVYLRLSEMNAREIPGAEAAAVESQQKALNKFLSAFLNGDMLPENLQVRHKLTSSGGLDGSDLTYGAAWNKDGASFYANMNYAGSYADYRARFQLERASGTDARKAESAKHYFKRFPGTWACRDEKTGNLTFTICESFASRNGYGEGVGLVFSEDLPQMTGFACRLDETNRVYGSCVNYPR